jgi:hypothetical protein
MQEKTCAHIPAPEQIIVDQGGACVDCIEMSKYLGAPAHLPNLWTHALLRLLAAAARYQALPRQQAPRGALR